VQRIGGASALGRHVGVLHSELRTYLAGDAMPPTDVLLKMVELIIEDLKAAESQFPAEAWRSPPLAAARKRA
jgi:hypothetical protein